ncbi:GGDEF domain-containing protein [Rhodopseudomonas sp. B29]|uniref:GGDEF domain-containing protein n=1 Tax=Rhodopseudomonas sp. B29 TaxID=95607 RepID=UPI0003450DCB|nr:GGDEF domain-containing protein [Rhodopseudomonas sp. B29]
MATIDDDHDRTMVYADMALAQIRALRQCAMPRNYEIWYVYATGYNPELNKAINETLTHNGRLTEADLEHIHHNYLAPAQPNDRIDEIGARVVREIDDMMSQLADTLGASASFGDKLQGASHHLSQTTDHDQIKSIVERLVVSTREMHRTNSELEERLSHSKQEIANLQVSLETIRAESVTDTLTGLGNRKHFDRAVTEAIRNAAASQEPLSLLLMDIDHFKMFNDNYGHLTGDQVLRLVGMTLKQSIKGRDITARYGGEEFAVVLPNTALRQAITVADNIRRSVMSKELKKKSTGEILGRVTISAGVSTLRPGEDSDSLIERADGCLYAAKRNGRNRVVSEADPEFLGVAQQARVA